MWGLLTQSEICRLVASTSPGSLSERPHRRPTESVAVCIVKIPRRSLRNVDKGKKGQGGGRTAWRWCCCGKPPWNKTQKVPPDLHKGAFSFKIAFEVQFYICSRAQRLPAAVRSSPSPGTDKGESAACIIPAMATLAVDVLAGSTSPALQTGVGLSREESQRWVLSKLVSP